MKGKVCHLSSSFVSLKQIYILMHYVFGGIIITEDFFFRMKQLR